MRPRDLSKYLSLILRHDPAAGGVSLDAEGWTDLDNLVAQSRGKFTRAEVEEVVAGNDKQRFTIKDGRIRANQGHTIEVNLNLEARDPPEFLYHGTYPEVVPLIQAEGLKKMARHHVHMAEDCETAVTVGRRSGTPVLFKVKARQMHQDGHTFFRSANGVWLVEHVPPQYLEVTRWR